MSDSEPEDLVDGEPPAIDPYEVLSLDRDATADQVKTAYRKAALKNHPDKAPHDKKEEAHTAFQAVAFAYAILSDPARRKRFDTTGSTSESIVDSDDFNWTDFYREQYQNAVTLETINKFAKEYKGSEEEKEDVLAAYEECEGNLDGVFQIVLLSDEVEDDERFRGIIDQAIEAGEVQAYPAYKKEDDKKRAARRKAAEDEAVEAEDYAKELGVHEQLFGGGDSADEETGEGKGKGKGKGKGRGKGKGQKNSEAALGALLQERFFSKAAQARSDAFLDHLAEKYGAKGSKKGKRGKRADEGEPSEEAFQAASARLDKRRAEGESSKASRSGSKRAKR